jgi:hypothetical protein
VGFGVGVVSDMKIKGEVGKPPLATVPKCSLIGASRVFAHGAAKYEPGNFIQGRVADGAIERYANAAERHLEGMQNGNGTWTASNVTALDADSGLPHIDHLICSLLILRAILIKDGVMPADPGAGKAVVPASSSTPGYDLMQELRELNRRAQVEPL